MIEYSLISSSHPNYIVTVKQYHNHLFPGELAYVRRRRYNDITIKKYRSTPMNV